MPLFKVLQAIQSAGVEVVGLDLKRTEVVLWSVDDQDDGETAMIRFRCVSRLIEKFGGSHAGRGYPPPQPPREHIVVSAAAAVVAAEDIHDCPRVESETPPSPPPPPWPPPPPPQ